jgi:hypothetical protein
LYVTKTIAALPLRAQWVYRYFFPWLDTLMERRHHSARWSLPRALVIVQAEMSFHDDC